MDIDAFRLQLFLLDLQYYRIDESETTWSSDKSVVHIYKNTQVGYWPRNWNDTKAQKRNFGNDYTAALEYILEKEA